MSGITESTDAVKHVAGTGAVKHDQSAVKHRPPQRYPLSDADALRMAQLSTEVTDRLAEMSRIFIGTVGEGPGGAPRFVPEPAGARIAAAANAAAADVTYVEIVCGPDGCGCYVTLADGTGFCEYPCGAHT
jgi:hypothetical protein